MGKNMSSKISHYGGSQLQPFILSIYKDELDMGVNALPEQKSLLSLELFFSPSRSVINTKILLLVI